MKQSDAETGEASPTAEANAEKNVTWKRFGQRLGEVWEGFGTILGLCWESFGKFWTGFARLYWFCGALLASAGLFWALLGFA